MRNPRPPGRPDPAAFVAARDTARAPEPTARLYRRPGGSVWYVAYQYAGSGGLKKLSLGTKDAVLAEQKKDQLLRDLRQALDAPAGVRWLDVVAAYMRTIKRPTTFKTWQRCCARWLETFGEDWDPWLADIDRNAVQRHVERRRRQGAADPTIRLELGFMSAVFGFHDPEGVNPVRDYGLRRVRKPREIVRFLTLEEEHRLLAACRLDVHRRLIVFAIETGLRKAEQFTLTPRQVDLSRPSVWIPPDKSKSGRGRTVYLTPRAVQQIEGHYAEDDPFVFQAPRRGKAGFDPFKGSPGWWVGIRNRAGVECRWHDLRHTFASRWIMDGRGVASLQKLLGHGMIHMTMRYAHLDDDGLRRQVEEYGRATCSKFGPSFGSLD